MIDPFRDEYQEPTARPVFGVDLDTLYGRDNSTVPVIVLICIQAIETFGIATENIYIKPGNSRLVGRLQELLKEGEYNTACDCAKDYLDLVLADFTNPANFDHDVHSVALLLKAFFRNLPEPLFPRSKHSALMVVARMEDDNKRRDILHGYINELADPVYAVLRVLILHLYKIAEHHDKNRMTIANLAIVWA